MTQLSVAGEGHTTPQLRAVAEEELLDPERLRAEVAAGRVVIPANARRAARPRGIGSGCSTKVNANIGTSPSHHDLGEELRKLAVCVDAGADAVMDLSTGGDLPAIRREILAASSVPVGTVPIYAVAAQLAARGLSILELTPDMLFDEIAAQCEQGVDFITVHCGVTRRALERLDAHPRVMGIVSRGGSLLARWMGHGGRENPLYEDYDRLLRICREHDVTLSLGDGLRPGSVVDAHDAAQLDELATLGELAARARQAGVQAMVEGPGHVPLDQIEPSIRMQKSLCAGAPFYVLGPLTTDIAAGYDHVSAAIGGAIAAAAGADFLCYVTAAEHLRLPTVEEVREGVVATRVAAHSADIVKLGERALARDRRMSEARRRLDWQGMFRAALDPVMARHMRSHSEDDGRDVCTMCGDLCAIRSYGEYERERTDARERVATRQPMAAPQPIAEAAAAGLRRLRDERPLVHNITNYVVMDVSANALLAIGAAPVMAHAVEEVEEMVGLARALVLNIGTLSPRWVEAMLQAGLAATARGIPVVLDPVGAGATRYRTDTALRILEDVRPTIVRGNASEILSLERAAGGTKGVDSSRAVEEAREAALALARRSGAVVAVTGPEDLVCDGQREIRVANGHPLMSRVTGTGCVASALTGAFAAVERDPLLAAASALVVFGIVGEVAAAGEDVRPGSFRTRLIDGLDWITPEVVLERARVSEA